MGAPDEGVDQVRNATRDITKIIGGRWSDMEQAPTPGIRDPGRRGPYSPTVAGGGAPADYATTDLTGGDAMTRTVHVHTTIARAPR